MLMRAIKSINESCDSSRVEILVRLSKKDEESLGRIKELCAIENVRVVIGEQGKGYTEIGKNVTELAAIAKGKWHALFDDDNMIDGKGWDDQLAGITGDCMVLHEKMTLKQSIYDNGGGDNGTGWIVPANCWKRYGHDSIGFPPDSWMHRLLVEWNGWTKVLLKGTVLIHDWQGHKRIEMQRLIDAGLMDGTKTCDLT